MERDAERQAIRECQRGQTAAFEVLVRAHFGSAYAAAVGILGNREDALDALQDAFTKAFRSIARFRGDREFYPWFYRILRNKCLDHLRRVKRRPRRVPLDAIQAEAETSFDPAVIAEQNERKTRVWRAVGSLTPDHREIIVLRHFQELSYSEISRVLEIPQGTVMSRLYAARQALRRKLEAAHAKGVSNGSDPHTGSKDTLHPTVGEEANS